MMSVGIFVASMVSTPLNRKMNAMVSKNKYISTITFLHRRLPFFCVKYKGGFKRKNLSVPSLEEVSCSGVCCSRSSEREQDTNDDGCDEHCQYDGGQFNAIENAV